jgi:hypothetical protein
VSGVHLIRARLTALAPLALLGLIGASPAGAASQIGETVDPSTLTCGGGVTFLQSGSPGNAYAAPSAGVITSWSYLADAVTPGQLKLKVGRRVATNTFLIVGESALHSPSPYALNSFPAQIPVQAGDVIGFYFTTSGHCGRYPAPGYSDHRLLPGDPAPGTTADFGAPFEDYQFDISARLEPDADNDGFGDETQDRCPTEPSQTGGPCSRAITFDASKSKVRKGKKVLFSGQLHAPGNEAGCESNQTVQVERRRPGETAFAALEQLQSDSGGAFSTKERVKKTYEYRAEVTESAGCRSAVSETQKVKAKKRKKKKS